MQMQTHMTPAGQSGTTPPGADSGLDSGVDHDYDQENDAHHVIQPQPDTDTASSDIDEGYSTELSYSNRY